MSHVVRFQELPLSEVGLVRGRDGIYVDSVCQRRREVVIKGSINGKLIENSALGDWIEFILTFHDVLRLRCEDADLSPFAEEFSFGMMHGASFAGGMVGRKHFVIAGYDAILEVLAAGFDVQLLSPAPRR